MKEEEPIVIPVRADVSGFSEALSDLSGESRKFGTSFSAAIKGAVLEGRSLQDTLRGLASRISDIALNAGLKPLETLAGNAFGNLVSSLGSSIAGSFNITPFASGGVVNGPTMFPAARGLGLMGEAGPEAILPLARGADGRLGVAAGGGGGARPVSITFNVSSPDAAGFKRSEGQIAIMLTRAVARGQRNL